MSGGIIINRSQVLLTAVTDPSIYNSLDDEVKDQVEVIRAKAPDDRTTEDCQALAAAIASACD
jgi:hypothetical protein